jgi:hypothetical protein
MILAVVGCCLGAAAAYAATRPDTAGQASRPLQPRFTEHPDPVTTVATARFDSVQPSRPPARAKPGNPLRFECRLDGGSWERCQPPVNLDGLSFGRHHFEVRAVNASDRSGPAAGFAWRIRRRPAEPAAPSPVAPSPPTAAPEPTKPAETPTPPPVLPEEPEKGEPFAIEQTAGLEDLYPGEPAQPLALRLTNPSPTAIAVTSLTFSFAADPPGCPSAENFTIVPSDASAETPIRIAAETSVELPAQGISPPLIAMRELPVNQDACQGATLDLKLEGEAQG